MRWPNDESGSVVKNARGMIVGTVFCLISLVLSPPTATALEFMADQITRVDRHSRKANLYYRDDRWRLEQHHTGPVNVTIVRKDKQLVWLILSRMKHFKTVPYSEEQAPKVSEQLDGEISREFIGTELREGHPTSLYLVVVRHGALTEEYYQWLATDIHFPMKQAKKDGSWSVEYRHITLKHLSDTLFELPVAFRPLEDFDGDSHGPPSSAREHGVDQSVVRTR